VRHPALPGGVPVPGRQGLKDRFSQNQTGSGLLFLSPEPFCFMGLEGHRGRSKSIPKQPFQA
jgi:hypothetical protein